MCLWLCLTENPKNAKLTKLGPIFQHRKEWFSGAIRDSAAVLCPTVLPGMSCHTWVSVVCPFKLTVTF